MNSIRLRLFVLVLFGSLLGMSLSSASSQAAVYVDAYASPARGGTVKMTPKRSSGKYEKGERVTIRAKAKSGYVFSEWSEDCPRANGAVCTVAITQSRGVINIAALFKRKPSLNVSPYPSAGGTITGSKINCGKTCSASFNQDSIVRLTATPAQGYFFSGWNGGGCDELVGNECSVKMTKTQYVQAIFKVVPTLSVKVTPSAGGTVTSTDEEISCGEVCSARIAPGQSVSLLATPVQGYEFIGWDFCTSEKGNTCQVTMPKNSLKVYADFAPVKNGQSLISPLIP